MAVHRIRPNDSVIKSGSFESAFEADTPTAADTLIVEQGAWLMSVGFLGIGAGLAATKAWTVTVNGSIYAPDGFGIILFSGNTQSSTIAIGVEGAVHGVEGIRTDSAASIKNAGSIFGEDYGIRSNADAGVRTVINSGTISGGTFSIVDELDVSTDRVTNSKSGILIGDVDLGGMDDALNNSGRIEGDVLLGDGNNKFVNSGTLVFGGKISGGSGADSVTNSGSAGSVELKEGVNTLFNSGSIGAITGGNDKDVVTNRGAMGKIELFEGDDFLTNSKTVALADLGNGHNKVMNSGTIDDAGTGTAVTGGSGNDVLVNSGTISGNVQLSAGKNSVVNSRFIDGILLCGDDADVVVNSGTISVVNLGSGANKLTNSGFISTLNAFAGDDVVINTGTIPVVFLEGGNDKYISGSKVDVVFDGAGADFYNLGGGNDFYRAQTGIGVDGVDTINGGAGIDRYSTNLGPSPLVINLDTVAHNNFPIDSLGGVNMDAKTAIGAAVAGTEKDIVIGFENVTGGGGADVIFGSSVANVLSGEAGDDQLLGFGGNDTLDGGVGSDKFFGGMGKDTFVGGGDGDTYYYTSTKESGITRATRDVIEDFIAADLIDLSLIDANVKNGAADDAFNFIGVNETFNNVAGELRAYNFGLGLMIEGDVNGDSRADFSIQLLQTAVTLSSAHFDL